MRPQRGSHAFLPSGPESIFVQYKTESFPESAETAEACRKFPMKKSNLGDRYIKIQFFVMILATGDNLPPAEQMF
jgi:hypothetical protein